MPIHSTMRDLVETQHTIFDVLSAFFETYCSVADSESHAVRRLRAGSAVQRFRSFFDGNSIASGANDDARALLELSKSALEVYVRRMYRAYHIDNLTIDSFNLASLAGAENSSGDKGKDRKVLVARWQFKSMAETAVPIGYVSFQNM